MPLPGTMNPAAARRPKPSAGRNNLPDPRPLTEYTAEHSVVSGHSRITVTLSEPCVIRDPKWSFIDADDGSEIIADSVTVGSNRVILFDFTGLIPDTVCFVSAPYQDMQVQNFQGGFVRPGGQWFRKP